MSVRACCLPFVCLCLLAGCQGPRSALFPWTDDSSIPSLTEAELKRSREQLTDETSDESARSAAVAFTDVTDADRDDEDYQRRERIASWLRRGQDALHPPAGSPHTAPLLSEATRSFREVLKLDAENADAWHGMAMISDLNEDWDLADMSYKRALASRPNDVNLLNDQGYSYLLQNRYHEAGQYLDRALQISPGHEKAIINLSILDIRRGHPESARSRLALVYPAAEVPAALAGLVKEHGTPADEPRLSRPTAPGSGGALVAGPRGPRHPAAQSAAAPLIASQSAPSQLSQAGSGLPTGQVAPASQPLFSQSGVIQPQHPNPLIRPAGASGEQVYTNRVATATMQRPAEISATQQTPLMPQRPAAPSPLDSARPVGGQFQMPADWRSHRPQLPASANVYNSGRAAAGGFSPTPQSPLPQRMPPQPARPQPATAVPAPGVVAAQHRPGAQLNPPGVLPQQAYPLPPGQAPYQSPSALPSAAARPAAPPQTFNGQYAHGAGPVPGTAPQHTELAADGRPVSIYPESMRGTLTPQTPALPPTDRSFYGAAGATGPAAASSRNPVIRPTGYPAFQTGYPSPAAAGPGYGSAAGAPTGGAALNPAAWSQPVPGLHSQSAVAAPQPHGQPGNPSQTAGLPTGGAAPIAPPHVSPPPLAGHGYSHPQSAATPDMLDEYRATRQQLESEYNQTLQRLNQPNGGLSFR